ncbi:MAG: hypothetical protein MUE96_06420 [Bacteroidia bacterium]|jgi:hypothetical protein|nr:hypothetical protein [Bacteroidia bacterium]
MSRLSYRTSLKVLLCITLLGCIHVGIAQDTVSVYRKAYQYAYKTFHKDAYGKNIIRYNPMPSLLFIEFKNAAVGYERVLWRNQSASVNIGYFTIPDILGNSIGAVKINKSNSRGMIASFDYRFYLKRLNTRPAPNGIYIGPYYSLYRHRSNTDFVYFEPTQLLQYDAALATTFNFHNIGFQLGYQFIFGKRITLDMVLFGPSVSWYNVQLDLESNLSPNQANQLYEKYYDQFFSKYPIFDQLFQNATFTKTNSANGILPNFRYLFQFGYHF